MIIIGCDLHTRSEQIAMLDTATGEVVEKKLEHEDGEAKRFYEGLKEPALVGIEATGYTLWFAQMLGGWGTSWWWAMRRRSGRWSPASRSTTDGTRNIC